MTPVAASVPPSCTVNSAPICCHPPTNVTENESVASLPWSLRPSVLSPPGRAAETGSHRVTAAARSGIVSSATRHPALGRVRGRSPRRRGMPGRATGRLRVWGGAAACPSDTGHHSGPRAPARRGQARAHGPEQRAHVRGAGNGSRSPLCDLEELSPPPPPCSSPALGTSVPLYFYVVCEIRWRLSRVGFWSGTELSYQKPKHVHNFWPMILLHF